VQAFGWTTRETLIALARTHLPEAGRIVGAMPLLPGCGAAAQAVAEPG
jgi:hypothetical protein